MWYFGGNNPDQFDVEENLARSDLWQYEIASNTWTLLSSGASLYDTSQLSLPLLPFGRNFPSNLGYGSSLYSPGDRYSSSSLYNNGSIFIFGGSYSAAFDSMYKLLLYFPIHFFFSFS
jgi:hypothetical protein